MKRSESLVVAVCVLLICGCASMQHAALDHRCEAVFRQALLREVVSYLSDQSGVSIRLSPSVAQFPDLTVDLQFSAPTPLRQILDAIVQQIQSAHGVHLAWSVTPAGIEFQSADSNKSIQGTGAYDSARP